MPFRLHPISRSTYDLRYRTSTHGVEYSKEGHVFLEIRKMHQFHTKPPFLLENALAPHGRGVRRQWRRPLGGHPVAQTLIGGSLRRPPWSPDPYWGKPQEATLQPRPLWGKPQEATLEPRPSSGEASGGHPGTRTLIVGSFRWPGGSLRRPPWSPDPYRRRPQEATLEPKPLLEKASGNLGEASRSHPGAQRLIRASLSRPPT